MSKVKNQHYVPQLYLRHFSTDESQKTVGLFNLKNKRFVTHAPIKNQASRDYFYGEDGKTEGILGQIEGNASPILKEIIKSKQLPTYHSEQTVDLYVFCLLMKARTKNHAVVMEDAMDDIMQTMLGYDENMKKYAGQYRIQLQNAAAVSVHIALNAIKDAFDLKCKVLVNESRLPFITSDSPMTAYNQFLEQRRHPGGHYGLLTKGLQLFLPISPRICLMFFDEWAYRIGERKKNAIPIMDANDVEKLNSLQLIQCDEQLFFDGSVSEAYVTGLLSKYANKRQQKGSGIREAGRRIDEEGNERIMLHSFGKNDMLNLQFSFCNLTKKAKQHEMSDYAAQIRDERLRHNRLR